MIPKTATRYCREDITLIENYEQALNDNTQIWDCHHILETELCLSANDLKAMGLYWKRPANEIIFLPHGEHMILHHTDKPQSPESKAKNSASHRGEKHPRCRAVYQIDKATHKIIRKWKYISDAAKTLEIKCSNIVSCCSGKIKSAYGYIWRYAYIS